MAIERMKSVWLFAPRGRAAELLDRLARMGLSHVVDCGLAQAEDIETLGIEHLHPHPRDIERRVRQLREIHDIFTTFHKTSREFLENFITTPVEVQNEDVRRALAQVNVEQLHADAKNLERTHTARASALQKAEGTLKAVAHLRGLRLLLPGRAAQRWTAAVLGTMPLARAERLLAGGELPEGSDISIAARIGRKSVVQIASPASERDNLLTLLRDSQCEIVPPEDDTVTLEEYLARRRNDVNRHRTELRDITHDLRETAGKHHRDVEIALGYWEERLNIANAAALMAQSKRLAMLKGYVRADDLEDLRRRLEAETPDVAILVRDPKPGESVPVSLKNPRFFAPAQFLVNMFGLPDYFTFDPTPFITFTFLAFFGLCFGDAVYGVMLIALGALLSKKYRQYTNLRNFFNLLAYAGVAAFIVGVLTGTWAADLFQYLGEGNVLLRISRALARMDPMSEPLLALGLALMLGVLNQLFGIVMLMVKNVRQGDPLAALFDGGFWLLLLPGLVILAAGMFVPGIPPFAYSIAYVVIAVGAVGLVLTQGRAEKTIVGKAVIGVVSLYGIVGTYGATTFVGDTLSYSRLLALGLTTTIVGGCFNVIAGMVKETPYVGIIIFALVVIVGHLFNFFISILGGFVHSARLTFVEFFGRFYEGGSPVFTPLGTWQGRIRVMDRATVWQE